MAFASSYRGLVADLRGQIAATGLIIAVQPAISPARAHWIYVAPEPRPPPSHERHAGELYCRSRRLPRRHAQTDREPDGTRSVCAEKVSIPDGAHVLRDAELLRYISAIFFDIHLREV